MSSEEKQELNVDKVIAEHIQPVGLWQILVSIFGGLNGLASAMTTLFVLSSPMHRCRLDEATENHLSGFSFEAASNAVGPSQFSGFHNASQLHKDQLGCYSYTTFNDSSSSLQHCKNGFVYKMPEMFYPDSLVIKWDLVCGEAWKVPFATTVYMLGMLVGYIGGGNIGGMMGRRRAIILLGLMQLVSVNLLSLSTSYPVFLLFRFLSSLSLTGAMNCFFVLLNELTLAPNRSLYVSIIYLVTGMTNKMFLALVGYFVMDWRVLNVLSMSPSIVSLLFPFFMPESPRWLISQGRKKEALYQLYQGYKMNHAISWINRQTLEEKQKSYKFFTEHLPELKENIYKPRFSFITKFMRRPYMDAICGVNNQQNKNNGFIASLKKLFGTKKLALRSIKCMLIFTNQIVTYFGLLYYTRIMKGPIYYTTAINALTAIPSTFLSYFMYKLIPSRRKPLLALYILTAGLLLGCGTYMMIAKPKSDIVLIVAANLAYTFLTGTQSMLMIFISELFPSDVRAQGLGNSSGFARIPGTLCDFINELDVVYVHGLPLIVYCGILVWQVILLLTTADTTGANLKDVTNTEANKNGYNNNKDVERLTCDTGEDKDK